MPAIMDELENWAHKADQDVGDRMSKPRYASKVLETITSVRNIKRDCRLDSDCKRNTRNCPCHTERRRCTGLCAKHTICVSSSVDQCMDEVR